MSSIAEVAAAVREVLTHGAARAAQASGLVQRQRTVTGPRLVQTLVLGWLRQPQASLGQLCQTAASLGMVLSEQGLSRRFDRRAAALLEQVLATAVSQVVSADPAVLPLLQRFGTVTVQDSSTVALPAALREVWQGCGGQHEQGVAALKVQVRWDLVSGRLEGPLLDHGKRQDRTTPLQTAPLPAGALRLADLGYFRVGTLADYAAAGVVVLSRVQAGTGVYDLDGARLEVVELLTQEHRAGRDRVDRWVLVGASRLRLRLLAAVVPAAVAAERRRKLHAEARRKGQAVSRQRLALADWTVLVTTASAAQLTLEEALVLLRVRWQVELLFKLWKQHGGLDQWRSQQPWRILCEVYAKLVGLVLQHWLVLLGCWQRPDRSLVKAAQAVRSQVALLVAGLTGGMALEQALALVGQAMGAGCRMNPRKHRPNTYQLLLTLDPA
jgi:hypothetical protein